MCERLKVRVYNRIKVKYRSKRDIKIIFIYLSVTNLCRSNSMSSIQIQPEYIQYIPLCTFKLLIYVAQTLCS